LCHCEKCRGFGLFVGTLLFWELVISFLLLWLICSNEINPWACFYLFIYSFMLNKLLGSFVEFCWINHLLICSIDTIWTKKFVLPHLLYPLVLLVLLSKLYLLWILKARCMHIFFMFIFVS
jgi:hypothetical protein